MGMIIQFMNVSCLGSQLARLPLSLSMFVSSLCPVACREKRRYPWKHRISDHIMPLASHIEGTYIEGTLKTLEM